MFADKLLNQSFLLSLLLNSFLVCWVGGGRLMHPTAEASQPAKTHLANLRPVLIASYQPPPPARKPSSGGAKSSLKPAPTTPATEGVAVLRLNSAKSDAGAHLKGAQGTAKEALRQGEGGANSRSDGGIERKSQTAHGSSRLLKARSRGTQSGNILAGTAENKTPIANGASSASRLVFSSAAGEVSRSATEPSSQTSGGSSESSQRDGSLSSAHSAVGGAPGGATQAQDKTAARSAQTPQKSQAIVANNGARKLAQGTKSVAAPRKSQVKTRQGKKRGPSDTASGSDTAIASNVTDSQSASPDGKEITEQESSASEVIEPNQPADKTAAPTTYAVSKLAKMWTIPPDQKFVLPPNLSLDMPADMPVVPGIKPLSAEQIEELRKLLHQHNLQHMKGLTREQLKKLLEARKNAERPTAEQNATNPAVELAAQPDELLQPRRPAKPRIANADPDAPVLPPGLNSPFKYKPWSPAWRERYALRVQQTAADNSLTSLENLTAPLPQPDKNPVGTENPRLAANSEPRNPAAIGTSDNHETQPTVPNTPGASTSITTNTPDAAPIGSSPATERPGGVLGTGQPAATTPTTGQGTTATGQTGATQNGTAVLGAGQPAVPPSGTGQTSPSTAASGQPSAQSENASSDGGTSAAPNGQTGTPTTPAQSGLLGTGTPAIRTPPNSASTPNAAGSGSAAPSGQSGAPPNGNAAPGVLGAGQSATGTGKTPTGTGVLGTGTPNPNQIGSGQAAPGSGAPQPGTRQTPAATGLLGAGQTAGGQPGQTNSSQPGSATGLLGAGQVTGGQTGLGVLGSGTPAPGTGQTPAGTGVLGAGQLGQGEGRPGAAPPGTGLLGTGATGQATGEAGTAPANTPPAGTGPIVEAGGTFGNEEQSDMGGEAFVDSDGIPGEDGEAGIEGVAAEGFTPAEGVQPNMPPHNHDLQKGIPGALVLPPLPPLGTEAGTYPRPHAVKPPARQTPPIALQVRAAPPGASAMPAKAQPRPRRALLAKQSQRDEEKPRRAMPIPRPEGTAGAPPEAAMPALSYGSTSARGTIVLPATKRTLALGTLPNNEARSSATAPRIAPLESQTPPQKRGSRRVATLAASQRKQSDEGHASSAQSGARALLSKAATARAAAGQAAVAQRSDDQEAAERAEQKQFTNSQGIKEGGQNPLPPTPLPDSDAEIGDGSGLKGEYYLGRNFDQYQFTRADPNIDFVWATDTNPSPNPRLPQGSEYSTRWTGKIQPRYAETYTLYAVADDGVRVWIDHKLIVDAWAIHGVLEYSGKLKLEAGKQYDIRVDYFEANAGGAAIGVYWESPSQPKEFIPEDRLFYPLAGDKALLELDEKPRTY